MTEALQTYPDGSAIRVGDDVLIEQGRTPATVEFVIASAEDVATWGLSTPGLMLLSQPFGRVFWPFEKFEQDPPLLVSRASKA